MQKKLLTIFGAAAILGAPMPASAGDETPEPARDAQGKILDRSHPDYVKCRTESVVGSRAKKRRVCLSNREWAQVARQGNGMAAALIEGGRAGIDWEAQAQARTQQPCQQSIC